MKRIFLFVMIAVLVMGFYLLKSNAYAQPANITETERQRILAATVQIRLIAPLLDEAGKVVIAENNGEAHIINEMAHGLGTLIQVGNQVQIVTHDHWGDLLFKAETAQFLDANGMLLAEFSGVYFRKLLRYRDQGTLLLQAPPELAFLSGVTGNGRELASGSQVFLTRHQPGYEVVEVVVAKVTAVSQREGVPVYLLQTLDGTPIVEGDSGGGIWFAEQLVGNLWRNRVQETIATINGQEIISQQTLTADSVAAVYPEIAQPILPEDAALELLP